MSHAGPGPVLSPCCCEDAVAAGARDPVSISRSVDDTVAAAVDGALVVVVVVVVVGASAVVVPVRNGRSNASFNRATFFGPKPGNRAICVASACAIRAKLCLCPYGHSDGETYIYRYGCVCARASISGEGSFIVYKWEGTRTPKVARRVSTSVLFTRGMLVSAVRRSASGVLSTRSRMSVGGRCSDCL